jgi:hypothetical protein
MTRPKWQARLIGTVDVLIGVCAIAALAGFVTVSVWRSHTKTSQNRCESHSQFYTQGTALDCKATEEGRQATATREMARHAPPGLDGGN